MKMEREDKPWYCNIYDETEPGNRPAVLVFSRFNRTEAGEQ